MNHYAEKKLTSLQNTANLLYRMFWVCFFLVSMCIFAFMPLNYFIIIFKTSDVVLSSLFAILVLLFIAIGSEYLMQYSNNRIVRFVVIPTFIFLLALSLRLIILYCIGRDTHQVSDFLRVYETSLHSMPINEFYYAIFSNWGMYSLFLKVIHRLFGASPMTGILMNAILSSLSAVLVYFIVHQSNIKNVFQFSLIAALLYSVLPTNLFYMILLTPEFIHVFCLLTALLAVLLAYRIAKKHLWESIFLYMVAAGMLSLSGFFKSVDKIMLIALVIAAILFSCLSSSRTKGAKKKDKPSLKSALVSNNWAVWVFFLAFYLLIGQTLFMVLDHYIGYQVSRNPAPYYISIGLSYESQGEWNPVVVSKYISNVAQNGYNYDTVNALTISDLMDNIQKNNHINLKFFWEKSKYAWQAQDYLGFSQATVNPATNKFPADWEARVAPYTQAFYLCIGLLTVIAIAFLAKVKPDKVFFISGLFIFGFFLLLLISENQPRYKMVTYPYLCILAGLGMSYIIELIKKRGSSQYE